MLYQFGGACFVVDDESAKPIVSIVTVNLNMADGLARTMASVAIQDFHPREYIVVDGGSKDRSVELLRDNGALVSHWISERDRGIYDAMNKGAALSRGRWVVFLNSGDVFASPHVLSQIFAAEAPDDDIIYGNSVVHYIDGTTRLAPAAEVRHLPFGMICSHQALFTRRKLLTTRPFSVGKIRSDYEFLLASWKKGHHFRYLDVVVAEVEAGGLSDRRRIAALHERSILLRKFGLLTFSAAASLAIAFFWALAAPCMKSILPLNVANRLRRMKQVILGEWSTRG
jgi:glycosyltransferase involved in cell wall biosynthesis